MGESFIPLAALVRGASAPAAASEPSTDAPIVAGSMDAPAQCAEAFAYADAIGDLALMRLAALDGYERACARLLESLASEVLGRELALAPPTWRRSSNARWQLFRNRSRSRSYSRRTTPDVCACRCRCASTRR